MQPDALNIHLDDALRLEKELTAARKAVAKHLRARRRASGHSLRTLATRLKLSPPAVSHIETGKSWETRTVQRVVRVYAALEEAA